MNFIKLILLLITILTTNSHLGWRNRLRRFNYGYNYYPSIYTSTYYPTSTYYTHSHRRNLWNYGYNRCGLNRICY